MPASLQNSILTSSSFPNSSKNKQKRKIKRETTPQGFEPWLPKEWAGKCLYIMQQAAQTIQHLIAGPRVNHSAKVPDLMMIAGELIIVESYCGEEDG
jgi:hypothetical protein